ETSLHGCSHMVGEGGLLSDGLRRRRRFHERGEGNMRRLWFPSITTARQRVFLMLASHQDRYQEGRGTTTRSAPSRGSLCDPQYLAERSSPTPFQSKASSRLHHSCGAYGMVVSVVVVCHVRIVPC